MKILIVDDEAEIRRVLELLLSGSGYETLTAEDGERASTILERERDIDLCIMDIMMPRLSGVEATRRIRKFSSVPILFLSAKSLSQDKALAYSSGGDDYIVKPFSASELLMKVEAMIRRYNSYSQKEIEADEGVRLAGGITVNTEKREVRRNGIRIELRDKEIDVLIYLVKNRGRCIGSSELYEAVWGEMPLPSSGNNITVHILNLRRKLEENMASPRIIRTVWGRGYQID
ncbi:MAG: response regulator transcription factor [Clostridia bacterium]|nr:response regulator transcription factor [Clostridia bacterium]